MSRKDFHKVVVGRAELLHFQELRIADIPVKVDTGAYRSAAHADKIELDDTGEVLSFRLLGNHPVMGDLATTIKTTDFKKVVITNSFGQREHRFEVRMRVKLGPKVFWSRFTLADRSRLVYPILLGRKMLNDRFIVDTGQTSVNRVELKKKFGIEFPADEEEGRDS